MLSAVSNLVLKAILGLTVAAGSTATAPPQAGTTGRFTGPGSCSASSCHGSVRPVAGGQILQTEYSTWIVQDKHAKATEVLTSPVSLRMARLLSLPKPDSAATCLACHSVDAPEPQRARSFAQEGVSCEGCHGPASGWLGPHTTRGWTHARSVEMGMIDTRNPIRRAEQCASCHIGNADKSVDHAMIAAGHPALTFDLEAFSAAMPRHWQESADDPWRDVRTWSAGQLTQLRLSLEQLSRRARGTTWPEYAEFDCFACHHSLTRTENSWRQQSGYADRRPGQVPWNEAPVVMARLVARELDPAAADRLDADAARLAAAVSHVQGGSEQVALLADGLRTLAVGLAQRTAARPVDAAATLRLMRAIAADAEHIAGLGERSAEQAAMSLETLLASYSRHAKPVDGVRDALDRLFQQLDNPSAYDPRRFATQLDRISQLLR